MKKLTVFESGIIGFLIGVIASAFLTFTISNNGFIGEALNYLSLKPLLEYAFNQLHIPEAQSLIFTFVFFILVYTLYGFIIGFIIKFIEKSKLIFIPIALILIGVGFEQKIGASNFIPIPEIAIYQPATIIKSIPQKPKQYFGNEVVGDLNNDGKDDVAFIINRNDSDRGILYYLTTSLTTDIGHTGTNLVFLGDKVKPQVISILNGIVTIDYLIGNSTSTKHFYAKVIDGNLQKIDSIISATSTASTTNSI